MVRGADSAIDDRILFVPPSPRDAELTTQILREAGIRCDPLPGLRELCVEAGRGVGAILLPEEILEAEAIAVLGCLLVGQPAWSAIPVVLLAHPRPDPGGIARALDALGHVIIVQRPVWIVSLLGAARAALASRARQYQIRDLLAQRERAEAELRDADRQKDQFLATLAHEMRNPLAAMGNALRLAEVEPASQHSAFALDVIGRQFRQLSGLIDDLLDISRIAAGKLTLRLEPLDVAAIVARASEVARPVVEAKRHRLTVRHEGAEIRTEGDPTRLIQVFANLLTNSAKYTPEGGNIEVVSRAEKGWVTVSVRDDGMGIPADMLPGIFDLFAQVDTHLEHAQGGLGVGLALVRRLVEMHGGNIRAESDGPGTGSTFTVTLPRLATPTGHPSTSPTAPAARDAGPGGPRTILIVDDNRDSANVLARLLRALSHDARAAYDGSEALEVLESLRPEVVLLDLGLPGLDGYEVARRIRADPAHKGVRLVALTGYAGESVRRSCLEAGFDAHFAKPVDPAALMTYIQQPATA